MDQTIEEKVVALETAVAALELWRDEASQLISRYEQAFMRMGQFVNDVRDAAVKANKPLEELP